MLLNPRLILAVLTLFALCASGRSLYADVPGAALQATGDTPAPAATQSGKGTITTVADDGSTVELRITDAQGKNAMTLVLTITPATKITRSKKAATVADLKPGDTASFSETPGSDPSAGTALTIDAKPKGKSNKGQTGN
jgi:hypothetical protein